MQRLGLSQPLQVRFPGGVRAHRPRLGGERFQGRSRQRVKPHARSAGFAEAAQFLQPLAELLGQGQEATFAQRQKPAGRPLDQFQ